jgi:hypothetical protein
MIGSEDKDTIEFGDDPYKHQLERTMELLESEVSMRLSVQKVGLANPGFRSYCEGAASA